MKRVLLFSVLLLSLSLTVTARRACTGSSPTWDAGSTWADVQSCHDDAGFQAGDTINISGAISGTSTVSLTKCTKLAGDGGGTVQGSSTTSLSIGTGSKAFTIQTGTVIDEEAWETGATVRAHYKAKSTEWMEGTVTSWSDPTLTLNITSSNGSGTYTAWVFETAATTTVTHNNSTSALLDITESTTADCHTEISGMRFVNGTGTGNRITLNSGGASGEVTLFHDIRQSFVSGGGVGIFINVNRGLSHRIYADCGFNWANETNNFCSEAFGWKAKFGGALDASWETVSSMGMDDANGDENFYAETCFVTGLTQATTDWDDNSRAVLRNCILDNSGMGSHGVDTSNYGQRHVELYDNIHIFDVIGASQVDTANVQSWFFLRGGTAVIARNTMPDINSTAWSDKPEVVLFLEELKRNAGPYACWGMDMVGNQYPAPRQIGFGRVDGSGDTDPTFGYQGDSEPTYIFSNGALVVSVQDGQPADCTGTTDAAADYVVEDRDFFYSTDATDAKPGWTSFTYPHPLADSSIITLVNPSSGTQGNLNLAIAVTGAGTSWMNGTTAGTFSGTGITVDSTTCASTTACTVTIDIASDATVSVRTLTMTTTAEMETANFTVNAAAAGAGGGLGRTLRLRVQ